MSCEIFGYREIGTKDNVFELLRYCIVVLYCPLELLLAQAIAKLCAQHALENNLVINEITTVGSYFFSF